MEFVQGIVSEGQVPGVPLTCKAEEKNSAVKIQRNLNGVLTTITITGTMERNLAVIF